MNHYPAGCTQSPEVKICPECNEPNGHKCGCSVAIERAAHVMRSYSQVQFKAWPILEAERIHLDDIAAGQKLANKRIEEDWANSIGMPNTRRPKALLEGFASEAERKETIASLMGELDGCWHCGSSQHKTSDCRIDEPVDEDRRVD